MFKSNTIGLNSLKQKLVKTITFASMGVLLTVSLMSLKQGHVQGAPSTTLNFQARIMNATGSLVPDGSYHIQFKLYDAASGGTNVWTETYSTSTTLVTVKNGFLSVRLGTHDSLADESDINWNEQLWLTMNIGGSGGAADWDGEMSPRIKLTAVPYAFQAQELATTEGDDDRGVLGFTTLSDNRTIWLPDEDGTLCIQNSTECGFLTGSTSDYIQNGTAAQTNANFNISASTGVAATITGASGQNIFVVNQNGGSAALTIASTGNATFAGDLAVNGGDITSTGALNVTPGGAMTLGATTQTATVQGSTVSVTSTGSGNDVTVTSADQIILNATTGGTDINGSAAIGDSAAVSGVAALNVNETFTNADACNGFGCHGALLSATANNVTVGGINGLYASASAAATSFTLPQAASIVAGTNSAGSGSTITSNYGLFVQTQSAGTNDYGIYVQGADTYGLWVDSGATRLDGTLELQTLGTANTDEYLCRNGSNILATCSNAPLTSATAFIQGGNSFSSTPAVLGTNNASNLEFETAGVTRLTLDQSGNATLTGNLTVQGTGTSAFSGTVTVAGNTTLGDASGDTITLNGTAISIPNNLNIDSNTLFIDASANTVGVGDATPDATLDVAGSFQFDGNGVFGDTSGDTLTITGTAVSIPNSLNIDSNTLYVDAANNRVGIGTASPGTALDVNGRIRGNEAISLQLNSTLTNYFSGSAEGYIYTSADDGVGGGNYLFNSAGHMIIQARSTANADIAFVTGTTPAASMIIDSAGNAIMGDLGNNPTATAQLDVRSTITGTTSSSVGSLLLLNQTTSGTQRGLVITNSNESANAVTESMINLDNSETTANRVTDYILITSAATDTTTDAIDVSDSDLFNAINVGDNYILGNGIQQYSSSSTVWTFEDTAGNDLMTITDAGTTGTVAITGLNCTGNLNGGTITANASGVLSCTDDNDTGSTIDLDGVYDNDSDKEMLIDNALGLTFDMTTTGNFMIQDSNSTIATFGNDGSITFAPTSGQSLTTTISGAGTLTDTIAGSGNAITNLSSTGDYTIQDNGSTFATFDDSGGITFAPNGTSDFTLTLDSDSNFIQNSTISGTASINVQSMTITNSSSSGTQQGLFIQNAASSGVTDALIAIDNADTDTVVTDGLLITSAAGAITDGVDATDTDIVNALNAGTNFILGNGIQQYSSSSTVWTFEDTAGNDLMTITDGGTTGNVAVTGTLDTGSAGAIGDNSGVNATAIGLNVGQNFTNTCGFGCYGTFSLGKVSDPDAGGAFTVSSITGVYAITETEADADLTLSQSVAIYAANPTKGAGSTITNNYGLVVGPQTAGTNNAGVSIGEATGTKAVNLLIGSTDVTSVTGSYSIYNSSTDQNYFAGNLGILDATPAAALTVGNGDLFQVNSSGAIAAATGVTSSGTITFSALNCSGNLNGGALTANGSGVLSCTDDNDTAASIDLDTAYDTDSDKELLIDSTTGLIFDMSTTGDFIIQDSNATIATFSNTGAITFAPTSGQSLTTTISGAGTLTNTIAGSGNAILNLSSTGDYTIQDNGSTFATFDDSGGITFAPNGTSDFTLTLDSDSNFIQSSSISGTSSVDVQSMTITNSTSSGTQRGLFIQNAASTGVTDALIALDNADTDTVVTDGILIGSAAGGITDGIDVSDTDIVNAINVGDNYILGNGIQQFSSSSTVWTFEDTGGNDLMTITDAGTTGNVAITGSVSASAGGSISGGTINLNASSNNATNINTGNSTGNVNIGNNTGNPTISIDSGTSAINIGTGAQARSVSIGTGGAAQTVTVGSQNTTSQLNLHAGTNGINLIASGSSDTGVLVKNTSNSANSFVIQNSSSDTLLRADTTNNRVYVGNQSASSSAGTTLLIVDSSTTSNLPAGSSTLNGGLIYDSTTNKFKVYENGQIKELCNMTDLGCGASASTTLQNAYDNDVDGSGVNITTTDADGTITWNLHNSSGTDPNFIVNVASSSTGEFRVQSNGTDVLQIGAAGQLQLDTQGSGGGLLIGTDTNLYRSAADTLRTSDALTVDGLFTGSLGASISGAAISLNASSNFATNINTGTSTGAVFIGNNTGNTAITIDSGTAAINIGAGGQARTMNIATGAAVQTLTIGSTNTTSSTSIQGGTGNITLTANGGSNTGTVVTNSNNSTAAFRIQSASAADTLFRADTTNNRMYVGNATASAGTDTTLLVVDSASTSNLPTGVNGGIVYDSTTDKFKVYEGGQWKSLCNTVDAGCGATGANQDLQEAYDNSTTPATIETSSNTKNVVIKSGSGFNSSSMFMLQSDGDTLFTADTSNNRLYVGNATGTAGSANTLFVLDRAQDTDYLPTGVNGGMIYDAEANKFKVYENGAWKTLCNTTDLGCGSAGVAQSLQDAYNNSSSPATIETSSTTKDIIFKSGLGFDADSMFQIQSANGDELFVADTANFRVAIGTNTMPANGVLSVGTNTTAATGGIYFGTDTNLYRSAAGVLRTDGSIQLGEGGDRTFDVMGRSTNAAGNGLTVSAGDAGAGGTAHTGGALTLQGGDAAGTTGNANGGNIILTAGAGVNSGSRGLVVIGTPTFSTSGTQTCAGPGTTCTINQADVDGNGGVVINATGSNMDVTLPNPTITTTYGRIVYVTAADNSNDFTLLVNGGGTGNEIALRENTTATMVWGPGGWTAAGASSSTTLQAAYDNTLTSAGGAELVLSGPGGNADGLTIRNNATDPVVGGILEVQSSIGTNLFSVNNLGTELASNGGAETAGASSSTFPAGTWEAVSGSISRSTTSGEYVTGQAGVEVATSGTNHGVKNNLTGNPVTGTTYQVSFAAKASSAITNNLQVRYTPDGGSNFVNCDTDTYGQDVSATDWTKVTCTIETDVTTVSDPELIIRQTDGTTRTIWIDNLSFMRNDSTTEPSNVQIGGGINGGPITLFTLDRSTAPPVADDNETYLGSMYYDTITGRIQCYEADGWGACGSAPNNYVNLTPEFAGAVLNGSGVGTMTADFCSNGTLSVNSSLCASGQAQNFYKWTSPQANTQSYSIYVTYQLPAAFKNFDSNDSVNLTARIDSSTNADVKYEMYRSEGGSLVQCGTGETDVTSTANAWQTVGINGDEFDDCGFSTNSANTNVVFKINVYAKSNASAYVGNLSFTTMGQ